MPTGNAKVRVTEGYFENFDVFGECIALSSFPFTVPSLSVFMQFELFAQPPVLTQLGRSSTAPCLDTMQAVHVNQHLMVFF